MDQRDRDLIEDAVRLQKERTGTWPECDKCDRQLPSASYSRGSVADEPELERLGWNRQPSGAWRCPTCRERP